ncbi:hypothetical protein ACHAXR_000961 [Thalassiosira sp. AJA248-18]
MKRRFRQQRHEEKQCSVDYKNRPQNESPNAKVHIGGLLLLLVAAMLIFIQNNAWQAHEPVAVEPIRVSYTPPSNVTNKFLNKFENLLSAAELHLPPGFAGYDYSIPLILDNGKILCRNSHKSAIMRSRVRSYIQMLNRGLERDNAYSTNDSSTTSLPIILLPGDCNRCFTFSLEDKIGFPRLTWSIPAPKYGNGWCQAIGMPGYESWSISQKRHAHKDTWFEDYTWDHVFKNDERNYPWTSKIEKAVWRGSTTSKWVGTQSFRCYTEGKVGPEEHGATGYN